MLQPPAVPDARPPRPLRTARVILWIQVAATGLLLVLQYVELASIEQHGEQVSSIGHFEIIENPIVFVIAVVAAIFVTSRRPWSRPLAIIVEMLAIINGIINVVSGLVAGIAAIGLAISVIMLLSRAEVSDWLNDRPAGHPNQEQPGPYHNQTS
jgi:inner membrane protein involved in colicin E2 resistance